MMAEARSAHNRSSNHHAERQAHVRMVPDKQPGLQSGGSKAEFRYLCVEPLGKSQTVTKGMNDGFNNLVFRTVSVATQDGDRSHYHHENRFLNSPPLKERQPCGSLSSVACISAHKANRLDDIAVTVS